MELGWTSTLPSHASRRSKSPLRTLWPRELSKFGEVLGDIPEAECQHIASQITRGTLSKRTLQNTLRGIEGRQRLEATSAESRQAMQYGITPPGAALLILTSSGLKDLSDDIDRYRRPGCQLTRPSRLPASRRSDFPA